MAKKLSGKVYKHKSQRLKTIINLKQTYLFQYQNNVHNSFNRTIFLTIASEKNTNSFCHQYIYQRF